MQENADKGKCTSDRPGKGLASVSLSGTFDTFIKFMWRGGCDKQFKKPLQITFAFKKEAEHSYVTLNNNSNWAAMSSGAEESGRPPTEVHGVFAACYWQSKKTIKWKVRPDGIGGQ